MSGIISYIASWYPCYPEKKTEENIVGTIKIPVNSQILYLESIKNNILNNLLNDLRNLLESIRSTAEDPSNIIDFDNSWTLRFAFDTNNIELGAILLKYGCKTNIDIHEDNISCFQNFMHHSMIFASEVERKVADEKYWKEMNTSHQEFKDAIRNKDLKRMEELLAAGKINPNDKFNNYMRIICDIPENTNMIDLMVKYNYNADTFTDKTAQQKSIKSFLKQYISAKRSSNTFKFISKEDQNKIQQIQNDQFKKMVENGWCQSLSTLITHFNVDVNMNNHWAIRTAFDKTYYDVAQILIKAGCRINLYNETVEVDDAHNEFVEFKNFISKAKCHIATSNQPSTTTKNGIRKIKETLKSIDENERPDKLFKIYYKIRAYDKLDELLSKNSINVNMENCGAFVYAYETKDFDLATILVRYGATNDVEKIKRHHLVNPLLFIEFVQQVRQSRY